MTSPRRDRVTLAVYGAIIFLAGSNFVAVRFSNAELPPFWGAAIRFAVACAILAAIVRARRVALPHGRALVGVIVYGALSFGVTYALLYWALRDIAAGLSAILFALVPLLTLFLAVAHGLERFRWRAFLGALVSLAGIAAVFREQLGGSASLLPALAVVAAAATAAESAVVAKMFPRPDPYATNAIGIFAGLVILVPLSFAFGEPHGFPEQPKTILAVAYLIPSTIGIFMGFLYVVRRWTATAASYVLVVSPIVTLVLAALLAGEAISLAVIAGGALVAAGVYLGALSS